MNGVTQFFRFTWAVYSPSQNLFFLYNLSEYRAHLSVTETNFQFLLFHIGKILKISQKQEYIIDRYFIFFSWLQYNKAHVD